MTSFGKLMTVFTVAVSLAFLGFVAIVVVGGPNWQAEANDAALSDFVFEFPLNETESFSVKARREADTFSKSSESLPDVVIAARNHNVELQSKEIQPLQQSATQIEARLNDAEQFISADLAAMQIRENELQTQLNSLHARIEELSRQGIQKAEEAYDKQEEASKRRKDVIRLRAQLDETRIDLHRTVAQKQKLRDSLVRYKLYLEDLKQRNEQLQQANDSYEK